MGKRIVNANSLTARDVLLETIFKIGSTKTEWETKEWLTLNLGTELFGVWLMFDDGDVIGLLTTEVIHDNSAFVSMDWVRGGISKGGLLEKAEQWANKLGLKKMIKYTNKSPTTYINKFGWTVWQTVLVKEL